MSLHVAGVDELLDDLDQLDRVLGREVRQVVSKGALNIKTGWVRRWSGHPSLPHLPRAISYDLHEHADAVGAQIGPDKLRPQGPLGNIIEFGTVDTPPMPGGGPAADDEAPRFERALADLAERLLAP